MTMPPPSASMAPDASPANMDAPIGPGVSCTTCGYSLLGLHPLGVCPECGTPCENALRGNLLVHSGEPYFRALLSGVGLILNAILLQVLVGILGVVAQLALRATPVGANAPVAIAGVNLALNAMLLYGWWRFSEPDPGYAGVRTGADARQVVRVATLGMAGLAVAVFIVQALGAFGTLATLGTGAGILLLVAGLVSLAASAVHFFASMLYLRWLAPRLPNRKVFDRAKRNMWLLPILNTVGMLLIGLGPLIALVMYWNHLDLVRKDLKRIAGERGMGMAPPR